ncbi:MAG: ankyrin repeat domain-containing protein, partial [Deltaproteobacteria bacterium]|nr:ankyrin repeat domain-containing protein [Deltaproteobacteria bacterium]
KDYFKDVPVPDMYTKSKKIKGGNYLARPANKNRNSTLTVTPMMIAALTNNVGYIKLLMKYGAKTSYDLKNFKYKRLRQNPVDIATDKKVIALLKMSGKSYSPIQKAVLSNNSELFSRVYPPKLTRKEKDRIFKFAINEGSDQIVKLLVEKFKYKLNRNDTNLLFAVFKSNNKDILEYLLSKKMGLGVKIDKYKLPRDIRYVNYKSKYLKYSSKSRKERYSKTNKFYILDVLYKKSLEMKNYKMAAMIDMYRSSWGKLHSLVVSGNMIEFKALLNEKPKLKDLKDNRGRTPLSLAVYYYREAALRELLQKGANPDIEDSEGKTPLMVCAENGKNEMIKILLNSGASLRNSKYSKCAVAASIAINNHKRLNRLAMIFRATASRYKNNSILNRFPYIKNAEHYKITAGLLRDAAAKRKVKGCKGFY